MGKLSDGSLGSGGGNPLEEIMKGVSETITSPGFAETVGTTMSSVAEKSGPRCPSHSPHTTPETSPNGPALALEEQIPGPRAITSGSDTSAEGSSTLIDVSGFSDLPSPSA